MVLNIVVIYFGIINVCLFEVNFFNCENVLILYFYNKIERYMLCSVNMIYVNVIIILYVCFFVIFLIFFYYCNCLKVVCEV